MILPVTVTCTPLCLYSTMDVYVNSLLIITSHKLTPRREPKYYIYVLSTVKAYIVIKTKNGRHQTQEFPSHAPCIALKIFSVTLASFLHANDWHLQVVISWVWSTCAQEMKIYISFSSNFQTRTNFLWDTKKGSVIIVSGWKLRVHSKLGDYNLR